MSALVIAQLICEKCGARVIGTRQTTPESYESYTNALVVAQHLGWSVYRDGDVEKSYCRTCSDGGTGDGSYTLAQSVFDEERLKRLK